jgi:hypothetical protein
LLLNDKNLDAKTKRLVTIVAAVAIALGVGTSYDWNPVSEEALAAAQEQAEVVNADQVYWTTFGRKYHLYLDCSSLANSANLYQSTVNDSFEAGRVDLCKFCASRAEAGEVITQNIDDMLLEEDIEAFNTETDGEDPPEQEPEAEPDEEPDAA